MPYAYCYLVGVPGQILKAGVTFYPWNRFLGIRKHAARSLGIKSGWEVLGIFDAGVISEWRLLELVASHAGAPIHGSEWFNWSQSAIDATGLLPQAPIYSAMCPAHFALPDRLMRPGRPSEHQTRSTK